MAKYEHRLYGDFHQLLRKIEDGILSKSISATLEEKSDFQSGNTRCSIRVFERYSYTGSSRVSLNVTLFQDADKLIHVSAIASGGSQALFFKLNTFGEEAFLEKFIEILNK